MNQIFKNTLPAALMLSLATFHAPVNSDMKCNGLNESSCSGNTTCTWVTGYRTKTGTSVNGYCRVKSNNKSAASNTKPEEQAKQAMQSAAKE